MLQIDEEKNILSITKNNETISYPFDSQEAFEEISRIMLRIGWDTKYVYSFTWLGRPIIQLPDDIMTLQELIYEVQPDVIVEIGVAHGGSLILSASICKSIEKGRVLGVDIEIRPHNRKAIEEHILYDYITLIEGDSISDSTFNAVKEQIRPKEKVLVLLDGKHTKEHVLEELKLYSDLVTKDSYIVAMDGIQKNLKGAPRSNEDWEWNNPSEAAIEFNKNSRDFELIDFIPKFNEGMITKRPTYCPNAFLKRVQ